MHVATKLLYNRRSVEVLVTWFMRPSVRNANYTSKWQATTAIQRTALPFLSSLDYARALVKAHESTILRFTVDS
jgi:hypothetical protein